MSDQNVLSSGGFGSGAGAVLGTSSGIANLASSLAARLGGSATSYFRQLRPASFRDVKFVSLGSEASFGRRNELHEYPGRDDPWVEDLGKRTRRIRMYGFVVGDDVIAQRDVLIAACETPGEGSLVHPTLGQLTVSLMDFRSIERWEKGRYFEFQFEFIEGGAQTYPRSEDETTGKVLNASSSLNLAAAEDFAKSATSAIIKGATALEGAVITALGWYTKATNLVGDARNLFKLLTNLPGDFGRFTGSATLPTFSKYPSSSTAQSGATTESLIEAATVARAGVTTASSTLDAAARALDASTVDDFSTAAQGLTASVLAATTDPADAVRLLSSLSGFTPSGMTTTSPIGVATSQMKSACTDLFRRSALASVAVASSMYQPTSSDDAASMRNQVSELLDAEIDIAGDQAQDATYEALRTLRAAVIADLNKRGAALSSIREFSFGASMPSLVLAQRIYGDATRADELVTQANPIHPAFMPTKFKAPSS
ncbi:DNA circularization protein [Paraburkholderia sp. RL17-381-BIF-C]|uniref:DNA circularization protein n=1 Tax=Paraburkholderia sp. RL17-381-BIF-C TaxID=3031635 RepID=UPI0038BCAD10